MMSRPAVVVRMIHLLSCAVEAGLVILCGLPSAACEGVCKGGDSGCITIRNFSMRIYRWHKGQLFHEEEWDQCLSAFVEQRKLQTQPTQHASVALADRLAAAGHPMILVLGSTAVGMAQC